MLRVAQSSLKHCRTPPRAQWQAWTWSASASFWDSRLGKLLHHAIHAVLLFLIALVLLSFWYPRPRTSDLVQVGLPSRVAASTAPIENLTNEHLFGESTMPAIDTAALASNVDVTGIVLAGANSEVILDINGKTDIYRTGAHLSDGETVSAITADSITLTRTGGVRELTLPRYGDPGSEGLAAYAALLNGIGLSSPSGNTALAVNSGASGETARAEYIGQPFVLTQVAAPRMTVPAARVVQLAPKATPLEQLRSLRAQLIR